MMRMCARCSHVTVIHRLQELNLRHFRSTFWPERGLKFIWKWSESWPRSFQLIAIFDVHLSAVVSFARLHLALLWLSLSASRTADSCFIGAKFLDDYHFQINFKALCLWLSSMTLALLHRLLASFDHFDSSRSSFGLCSAVKHKIANPSHASLIVIEICIIIKPSIWNWSSFSIRALKATSQNFISQ